MNRQWRAASETTLAWPSSNDRASTTSIPRPRGADDHGRSPGRWLVRIRDIDHPVSEARGSAITLFGRLFRIGERQDEARGEVPVDLPIAVPIELRRELAGRHTG